jgi:hypothetical protein
VPSLRTMGKAKHGPALGSSKVRLSESGGSGEHHGDVETLERNFHEMD